MNKAPKAERFLEPVYLNETMTLNCAAYLFGGYSLESDQTTSTGNRKEGSVRAGLGFLNSLIGISGSTETLSNHEQRAARRFTVGGLHMNVLNALYQERMISSVSLANLDSVGMGDTYVDVHAVLRPSEYQSLLGTLKTLGPLVAQIAQDFGEKMVVQSGSSIERWKQIEPEISKYEESVLGIVEKLEHDYLTSKQLDMVMWSTSNKLLGVVDLDVTDNDSSELRAKLSGGHYHVIGKIVAKVGHGETLSLLQKTMLYEVAELIKRLVSAANFAMSVKGPAHLADGQAKDFFTQVSRMVVQINKVVSLEIPGPAIRVAAMSVCL